MYVKGLLHGNWQVNKASKTLGGGGGGGCIQVRAVTIAYAYIDVYTCIHTCARIVVHAPYT